MVNVGQRPSDESDEPEKGGKKRIKSIEEIEKEAHELLNRVGGSRLRHSVTALPLFSTDMARHGTPI
jgi:hypothetical protein